MKLVYPGGARRLRLDSGGAEQCPDMLITSVSAAQDGYFVLKDCQGIRSCLTQHCRVQLKICIERCKTERGKRRCEGSRDTYALSLAIPCSADWFIRYYIQTLEYAFRQSASGWS